MVVLAEPDPSDMVLAIKKAISILPKIDPQVMHNRVSAKGSGSEKFYLYSGQFFYFAASFSYR